MITVTTLLTKKAKAMLTLSLVIGVAIESTVIAPVFAEEAMVAQAESLSPDQESLLPPEVVPLDPQAATSLSQSQAASRSTGMTNPIESANAPGLSNGQPTGTPTAADALGSQSARDFRKDMYDSLMSKGSVQPNSSGQWNPNQFNPQQGTRFDPQQAQTAQQPFSTPAQGQSAPPQGQFAPAQVPQTSQSQWMNSNGTPAAAQSQTLSGGVQQPAVVAGSGKGFGIAHGVSMVSMLGMGFGSILMGRGPGRFYTGGLMGLGLMNYGVRNGFRF